MPPIGIPYALTTDTKISMAKDAARAARALVSWDQRFFDPITVPGRKPLVTLRDAARYITKLPKAEHDANEWQGAMEALLLVAEHDGPTMFARIGVMRALQRHQPKTAPALRRLVR
jgi:hypothetical protein